MTLSREASVGDALAIMKEHRIGGIPVVDETNTLVGIVTNRDLRFEKNYDRAVAEVMTDSNLIVTQDGSILKSRATPTRPPHRKAAGG